jgi:hypothetical protein
MQTQNIPHAARTRSTRESKLREVPPVSSWPMPVTDSFDPIKRDIFMKKRLAVELYVAKSKADEIEKRTGYDLSQARRLTERCLLKNPPIRHLVF